MSEIDRLRAVLREAEAALCTTCQACAEAEGIIDAALAGTAETGSEPRWNMPANMPRFFYPSRSIHEDSPGTQLFRLELNEDGTGTFVPVAEVPAPESPPLPPVELNDREQEVWECGWRAGRSAPASAPPAAKEAHERSQALGWCVMVHEKVAKKLDDTWPNDPLLRQCEQAFGRLFSEIERLEKIAYPIPAAPASEGRTYVIPIGQENSEASVELTLRRAGITFWVRPAVQPPAPRCIACEDKPKPGNDPCAVCGAASTTADQPRGAQ